MTFDPAVLAALIVSQLDKDCLIIHSTPSSPTPAPTLEAANASVELLLRRWQEEHA